MTKGTSVTHTTRTGRHLSIEKRGSEGGKRIKRGERMDRRERGAKKQSGKDRRKERE